jgi:hypothetical protein
VRLLHKLTLLLHSVLDDYDGVQELLSKLGESKRFPLVVDLRHVPQCEDAKKWLRERRNETFSEFTFWVAAVAMLAATVAAVR